MKTEVDIRPKTNNNEASAYIRLYPETNEEMANLQWILEVFKKKYFISSCLGKQVYSVIFE